MLQRRASHATETPVTLFLMICMGLLLNQSNVLFGLNVSFADGFLILLFFIWMVQKKLEIPPIPLLIFVSFSILLLWNSVFLIPHLQHLPIGYSSIAKDYLKLVVMFLYFLFGWHIVQSNWLRPLLLSFFVGATVIGALGFVITFYPISGLTDTMLYSSLRLKGFMNDPNYFSVVQCTAIVCAIRLLPRKSILKFLSIFLLTLSIFVSGSKTGIITLIVVALCTSVHSYLLGEVNKKRLNWTVIGGIGGLVGFLFFLPNLEAIMNLASDKMPALERTVLLFTNFKKATMSSGSGRGSVWETAIHLTRSAPFLGVGVGNYGSLAMRFSGDANVAHNTFLQLSAEWGIPITVLFILFTLSLLTKVPEKGESKLTSFFLKEVVLVFLISSMSISFNHSRLFWLFLGSATHYFYSYLKKFKEEGLWQKHMES